MNGGTLPARNPITRPVSFHSLSEHNKGNQAHLAPYSRRPRTPRSSPLAGPSLSSDELNGDNKDDGGSQKPRYRPNRISSTPDMAARTQSLYNPDTSSDGAIGIVISPPPATDSSTSSSSDEDDKEKELGKGGEDGSRLRSFAKRLSIVSNSSLTTNETDKESQKAKKRRSSLIPHSASTTSLASTSSSRTARTDKTGQTAPPIPTIPRWALNAMREEDGAAKRNTKYGHRRGTSDDSTTSSPLPPLLSNQPIPRGSALSTSGLINQPRPPSVSRDPTENWMSVTDQIPRFTRLSLQGTAVVLPVKKKDSLAKMKSSSSIKTIRSTSTISQSTGTRRDSGGITRTETDPKDNPNLTTTHTNLKEDGLRKRSSSVNSLKSKISSSTESEHVPSLPPSNKQRSGSGPVSVPNLRSLKPASNDSASKIPKMTAFPPMPDPPKVRASATLRRESTLPAIDEDQPPSPSPANTEIETRDAQETRPRRKSIKQIVMRITTAPMAASEKLKCGFHNAPATPPVVSLPPDSLDVPLDPPPPAFFRKTASSSVPSLPSTRGKSESTRNQGDARGGKMFKSIRRRWNAVFGDH